jgi:hypothetical protein
MNRDDIIRMVDEARLTCVVEMFESELERFAALIAAAEREANAKVCEAMRPTEREFDQRFFTACTLNANAIRARSQA